MHDRPQTLSPVSVPATGGSDSAIRHVVGVMTGTSIDGLDAALVRIIGVGLAMRAELVRHVSWPLGALAAPLRAAAAQQPLTAGDFATMGHDFGMLHADAIASLVKNGPAPDLVVAHGQTVVHRPPVSWQLLNAAPIAHRFNCPVVCDLRQADLAAGGQGAPITPLADWILFRAAHEPVVVINLGGFCNITVLPGEQSCGDGVSPRTLIRGMDVCACNHLLNEAARVALGEPFDRDGAAALRGSLVPDATETLIQRLQAQHHEGRSLGTGDERAGWLDELTQRLARNHIRPDDLLATVVESVGRCIGHAVRDGLVALTPEHAMDERAQEQAPHARVIAAGGGARNEALLAAIARTATCPVRRSDAVGVPVECREAMGMAVLGALAQDGVPVTLPQVTGRGASIAPDGCWWRHGVAR